MYATKTLLAAAAMAALGACSDLSVTGVEPRTPPERVAPLRMAAPDAAVPGMYIVVLKEGADAHAVANAAGARPGFFYDTALNGFAGELNQGQLTALRHNPHVDYIQQGQVATLATVQSNAPWNLLRISQRGFLWSNRGNYVYAYTASNVHAYVIDSGIYTHHWDFGGRATLGPSFVADGRNAEDCNGHGTHVAGIIGGGIYGVAKGVQLVSVRVADCQGKGWDGQVIKGIDWVAGHYYRPAVANLSLGFDYNQAINDAVTNLANRGVFVVVSAGNENQDACNHSPASAPAVMTVASSTDWDRKSSFSNWGRCVDLYAPGSDIPSDWLYQTVTTLSGTSMAAPHVAGLAALIKGAVYDPWTGDKSQSWVDAWIKAQATQNAIYSNPAGTPNLLLFKPATL